MARGRHVAVILGSESRIDKSLDRPSHVFPSHSDFASIFRHVRDVGMLSCPWCKWRFIQTFKKPASHRRARMSSFLDNAAARVFIIE